jgi:hypothetical protein
VSAAPQRGFPANPAEALGASAKTVTAKAKLDGLLPIERPARFCGVRRARGPPAAAPGRGVPRA